jgi:hypothetical protein
LPEVVDVRVAEHDRVDLSRAELEARVREGTTRGAGLELPALEQHVGAADAEACDNCRVVPPVAPKKRIFMAPL